jgi:hypothetical protein
MRNVKVWLESITPYSQSRPHETPKLAGETNDAMEIRTWREKCNADDKTGIMYVPAMALKQCLDSAAQKSGDQIAGRGKSTFTKYFKADCVCNADVPLGILKKDVGSARVYCNVDGIRGSGKRVWRTFPQITAWKATAHFTILDNTISEAVFEKMLKLGGMGVGIGRFRPEKGGLNGRFKPVKYEWS